MAFEDIVLRRVESLNDVLDLKAWLGERRPILAVDIETEGLNVGCDRTRLFQFGDGQQGWALDYQDWRGAIRELVHAYERPMVCHNLLFEAKMLKRDGIILPQRLMHDTMIMAFLTNPASRMDLKGNATRYVDRRAAAGQGLLEAQMAAGDWTWRTVPTDLYAYWAYGTLDTVLTALLAEKLWPNVRDHYRYPYELELACIHCLREAELNGLMVDEETRIRTRDKLVTEIQELEPQIPIENPNSDRQVLEYLRGIGAGPFLILKTEKGNTSTDKHALEYVAANGFPVAALISRYRNRVRTLGNYIEKFAEVGSNDKGLAVDGILHASTRPVGARTGRMSITDPPLQTLPRGRVVRDCIIARPGHRILQADFSGMEMRAFASLAQETEMLAAYARGEDLHDFVATSVYGENFTKPQRATAKNAGFAKIYYAGVVKFAATAKISIEDATAFLQKYDEMFPRVNTFMGELVDTVRREAENGWGKVTLQDGRDLPVEVKKAYVAVNYRIQGGTAVVVKERINALDAAGMGPFFRLAVHDELLFEVPEEHVPQARAVIARVMPDSRSFPGVTLEIEQDEVLRWGEHYRGPDYPAYVPTEPAPWLREEAA